MIHHYKTLRGWWWVWEGVLWLSYAGESVRDHYKWLLEIERQSWRAPASHFPFTVVEAYCERRYAKGLVMLRRIQKSSTWYAWRVHITTGLAVVEVKETLEKGDIEELFSLCDEVEVRLGAKNREK